MAELVTPEAGLYAVRYEDVLSGPRGVPGLEPSPSPAGPECGLPPGAGEGAVRPGLGALLRERGREEQSLGRRGLRAGDGQSRGRGCRSSAALPGAPRVRSTWTTKEWEQNRYYQAGLLEAPDLWQWDLLVSPVTKSYPFTLSQVAASSTALRLTVWLQGASDFEADPDHHLRVSVNGQAVGEASWDGKTEKVIEAEVVPGNSPGGSEHAIPGERGRHRGCLLHGVPEPVLPDATRGRLVAERALLEGAFGESGTRGRGRRGRTGYVVDTGGQHPQWLSGVIATPSGAVLPSGGGPEVPGGVDELRCRRPWCAGRCRAPAEAPRTARTGSSWPRRSSWRWPSPSSTCGGARGSR